MEALIVGKGIYREMGAYWVEYSTWCYSSSYCSSYADTQQLLQMFDGTNLKLMVPSRETYSKALSK